MAVFIMVGAGLKKTGSPHTNNVTSPSPPAFWYGCKLVMDYRDKPEYLTCMEQCLMPDENGEIGGLECFLACDRFTVGSVTTAIFGILNGGMQIGQSSMYVEAVATAKAAAVQIFHVIDR